MKYRILKKSTLNPKKNIFCDSIVGIDKTSRSPHLIQCKKKAEFKIDVGKAEWYICSDCLERLERENQIGW